jgi:hypothetical protein
MCMHSVVCKVYTPIVLLLLLLLVLPLLQCSVSVVSTTKRPVHSIICSVSACTLASLLHAVTIQHIATHAASILLTCNLS